MKSDKAPVGQADGGPCQHGLLDLRPSVSARGLSGKAGLLGGERHPCPRTGEWPSAGEHLRAVGDSSVITARVPRAFGEAARDVVVDCLVVAG